MSDVALKIPLPALVLARLRQGDHVALARIHAIGDGVDDPALPGGVASFEQHQQALTRLGYPAGYGHEFPLKRLDQRVILLALQLRHAVPFVTREPKLSLRIRNRDSPMSRPLILCGAIA